MGRGKVKLQRIEDGVRRMASFSKRRSGLLKKARELAVLCDAEVAVLVFSPKGKLSSFSSLSCVEQTVERYLRFTDAERKAKENVLGQKGDSVKEFPDHGSNSALTFEQRSPHQDITDLWNVEENLRNELRRIRSMKMALMKGAGVDLPQLETIDESEGSKEEGKPRRDSASPPSPRTLGLFTDV